MSISNERFKELMKLAQQEIDFFELHRNDVSAYENKEDAEFVAKYHTQRVERFEPPTWEELFKEDRVLDCYTQEFGIAKNRSFIGVVLLGVDFTNEIVEVSIGSDQIFCELLSKENYYKAVEKARKLFLGESDEN